MTLSISKEDEILYKEIMTMDNVIVGYVAAIDYNDIIGITKQEYKIPKSMIIRYNDTEILVDVMFADLDSFMIN
jgi:hypothetical protein